MNPIFSRRSVRNYQRREVESEKITQLLKAGMQAPSGGNQQPWEYIVVKNRDLLNKVSQMSPYAKMVAKAPAAIIVLGNMERCRFPELWEQDLAASTQNILLEMVNLELGGVWLGVAPLEDRMEHLTKIFNFTDNLKPFCVIPFGYPAFGDDNVVDDRFDPSRIKEFK